MPRFSKRAQPDLRQVLVSSVRSLTHRFQNSVLQTPPRQSLYFVYEPVKGSCYSEVLLSSTGFILVTRYRPFSFVPCRFFSIILSCMHEAICDWHFRCHFPAVRICEMTLLQSWLYPVKRITQRDSFSTRLPWKRRQSKKGDFRSETIIELMKNKVWMKFFYLFSRLAL